MELIKDLAEEAFAERIRELNTAETYLRCIYLNFARLDIPVHEWFPDVSKQLEELIDAEHLEMYLCHDGDLFVLARPIDRKLMLELIDRLEPIMAPAPVDRLISLFETSFSAETLLKLVEHKIVARHDEVETKEEEHKQEEKDKFYQLSMSKGIMLHIHEKRRGRKAPEILVIDDDPFSQKLVSAVVETRGKVWTADNGYDGVMTYARQAPDILFLDIGLPDVSGHEVLDKIFEMDPQAYVVMLSGYGNKENIVKAVGHGAKGFVGKPFSKGKLLDYIDKSPFYKR